MALSRKMLVVLQRVDAAHEEFLAGLRDSARQDAKVREQRKEAESAKRKPPKLIRVTSTASKQSKAPAKRPARAR